MRRHNLAVVRPGPEPRQPEEPMDITGLIRADIHKIDWGAMHIAADKRPFRLWADTRKWRYR